MVRGEARVSGVGGAEAVLGEERRKLFEEQVWTLQVRCSVVGGREGKLTSRCRYAHGERERRTARGEVAVSAPKTRNQTSAACPAIKRMLRGNVSVCIS